MDIRNIKVPDTCNLHGTIGNLFEIGTSQLDNYSKAFHLEKYPVDSINKSSNQVLLKDYIGRVIEEISEGYESTSELVNILHSVGWNIALLDKQGYKNVINQLQNANEEQADAIGFFISLMLYSNILAEDVCDYVASCLDLDEPVELDKVMSYGVGLLYNINPAIIEVRGYHIITQELCTYYDIDYTMIQPITPGFNNMSDLIHEVESNHLWFITHQLNIARNLLKNRPWKNNQVMTKEVDYQEALVKAFIMYLGFLAINGFTPESLIGLFIRKKLLNDWRISTGY